MKFIHVSDLHIGKRVGEYSMLDDQKHALSELLRIIDDEQPDALVIAGDVYDKSMPPAEAVEIFDWFVVELASRIIPTFIISGNHDSPERLAFLNKLIDPSGIHISSAYKGKVEPISLKDEFGEVFIYMLPFVKPQTVRRTTDEDINSYTQAVAHCIKEMNVDHSTRNVLVTHQFVAGAERTESEEISVGGSDSVDPSVFSVFDYVALGHIHRAQSVSEKKIRYSGTPLKYSFSEINDVKGAVVAELGKKGELNIRFRQIKPLRDMAEIRGTYEELTAKSFYEGTNYRDDYLKIVLTDEEDVLGVGAKLRVIYKNYIKIVYDNARTRESREIAEVERVEEKTPLELFRELYVLQNNSEMTEEQETIVRKLIAKIWGGEDATEED